MIGRFNFGLDKVFETHEDASDFEITAFLNGSKAKQKCYKDKSDVKRIMTFIKDISEENGETKQSARLPPMELDKILCTSLGLY